MTAERQAAWLRDVYALATGDAVEVELLVPGPNPRTAGGPRLVEGVIVAALPEVLVLETLTGVYRIRWAAIATIRTAPPAHPATT